MASKMPPLAIQQNCPNGRAYGTIGLGAISLVYAPGSRRITDREKAWPGSPMIYTWSKDSPAMIFLISSAWWIPLTESPHGKKKNKHGPFLILTCKSTCTEHRGANGLV